MSRRSSEVDGRSQLHLLQILRHFAAVGESRMHIGEVDFDDEIHETQIVVGRRRSVRTDHQFSVDSRELKDKESPSLVK